MGKWQRASSAESSSLSSSSSSSSLLPDMALSSSGSAQLHFDAHPTAAPVELRPKESSASLSPQSLPSTSRQDAPMSSRHLSPLSIHSSSSIMSPPASSSSRRKKRPRCHFCGELQRKKSLQPQQPWRRILYEKQLYDDNYVDESFLSSMVTNANVRPRTFRSLVFDSLAIGSQFSITMIFFVAFFTLFRGWRSVQFLIGLDIICIASGSAAKISIDATLYQASRESILASLSAYASQLCLFLGLLFGLSPVLMTLTSAYSDDTIWALTFILCSVHVFMHDYSFLNAPHRNTNFEGPISLNAAVFASVLLASRLPNSVDVFAFVLFAFTLFAGFPFLARSIHRFSERLHVVTSVSIMLVAVLWLSTLSIVASIAMLGCLIFITVLCPFWLKWIQRYKHEIQGPWDYDAENEIPGE